MKVREDEIIAAAEQYVRHELESDHSGHDWWHIERVRRLAIELAKLENADRYVCELTALLHDIGDEKLNNSKIAGLEKVRGWLEEHHVDQNSADKVMAIIATMSYNGGKNPPMDTIEGKVVQDADRLDALGAIGIARTFQYSGMKGQLMHTPGQSFEHLDYRSNQKTAIYHFYEKLLKIKGLLNTEHAKRIAEKRHQFMETYLDQFFEEWDSRDIHH